MGQEIWERLTHPEWHYPSRYTRAPARQERPPPPRNVVYSRIEDEGNVDLVFSADFRVEAVVTEVDAATEIPHLLWEGVDD